MLLKLLTVLIEKERAISLAISFVLGVSATTLGFNAEVVKANLCDAVLNAEATNQEE